MNRLLLSTSLALALSGNLAFAQQQDAAPAVSCMCDVGCLRICREDG